MPLSIQVFGLLAKNKTFLQSDKFPILIYDGLGWKHTIQCVQMHNTLMYADSNARTDEMWGLHVGTPNMEDGTFFPYFWEKEETNQGRMKIDQLQREHARPDPVFAMNDGAKPLPYYIDEMMRFTGMADAGGTNLRLMYMFVCSERWCQTKGVGWTV